jgi:hypothetical protein
MNAVCRRDFYALPSAVSPTQAIQRFWRKYVSAHSNATFFYFAFDSPDRIPDMRMHFLQNERYTTPGPPLPPDWSITARATSLSWQQAFGARESKNKMWSVLAQCLHEHVMQVASPGVAYVIDPPSGQRLAWPLHTTLAPNNYGEADLKAAAVVASCSGPTMFCTIDWDAVVQGALLFPPAAVVNVGRVYKHGNEITFSKRTAPAGSVAVPELVRPAGLPGHTAWSPQCRWSYTFALMCIGGIDYCEGLKRFGYREKVLTSHLGAHGVPEFFTVDGSPREIEFDVALFRDWLLPVVPYRPRSKCARDLSNELVKIVWCVLYLALVDSQRPRAGPAIITVDLFPGCETLHDAMRVRQPLPHLAYTEQFGLTNAD